MAASEPGPEPVPPLCRSQKANEAFGSPADAQPAGTPPAEPVDGSSSEQGLTQATTVARPNSVDDTPSSISGKIPSLPFRQSPARSHKRQWQERSSPQPHIPGHTAAPFPFISPPRKEKKHSVCFLMQTMRTRRTWAASRSSPR